MTKDLSELLPCPFCGNLPSVDERPVGAPDFHQARVHVTCHRCNACPHVSGSRTATEWVGKDRPNKRYCSAEEAITSAREQAYRYWNTRTVQALPKTCRMLTDNEIFQCYNCSFDRPVSTALLIKFAEVNGLTLV